MHFNADFLSNVAWALSIEFRSVVGSVFPVDGNIIQSCPDLKVQAKKQSFISLI